MRHGPPGLPGLPDPGNSWSRARGSYQGDSMPNSALTVIITHLRARVPSRFVRCASGGVAAAAGPPWHDPAEYELSTSTAAAVGGCRDRSGCSGFDRSL